MTWTICARKIEVNWRKRPEGPGTVEVAGGWDRFGTRGTRCPARCYPFKAEWGPKIPLEILVSGPRVWNRCRHVCSMCFLFVLSLSILRGILERRDYVECPQHIRCFGQCMLEGSDWWFELQQLLHIKQLVCYCMFFFYKLLNLCLRPLSLHSQVWASLVNYQHYDCKLRCFMYNSHVNHKHSLKLAIDNDNDNSCLDNIVFCV